MTATTTPAPLVSRFRPGIQVAGLVRKEIVEIARQPRLLAVLVLGPFLVLTLFAVGYDQQSTVLRTAFVGPEESLYSDAVERFTDELAKYVEPVGYSSDLLAANERLSAGEIDLIVIFPPDPAESVTAGSRAVITVLHDKLDPIQQTAVQVSAEVAVQELNAIVIEQVFTEAQSGLLSYEENIGRARVDLDALEAADRTGDEAQAEQIAESLAVRARALDTIIGTSVELNQRLDEGLGVDSQVGADSEDRYHAVRTSSSNYVIATSRLADASGRIDPVDLTDARMALETMEAQGDDVRLLEPAVIARPFVSDTENILRAPVGVTDYFAPAAIALLVQHMVLTFGALGLVSDRARGLFEVLRVGPIGAGRVLLGRYLAYTLIGGAVATVLLMLISVAVGVPFRGQVVWIALGMLGLLVSSIGFGLVLSMLARSETQAVQFAMLALLAAMFFGDFFLPIESFRSPINIISWLLPVTYGIRLMRDVMLRGAAPAAVDLVGLATLSAVFALAGWALFTAKLRRV